MSPPVERVFKVVCFRGADRFFRQVLSVTGLFVNKEEFVRCPFDSPGVSSTSPHVSNVPRPRLGGSARAPDPGAKQGPGLELNRFVVLCGTGGIFLAR